MSTSVKMAYGKLLRLAMQLQVKAVGEQRLEHDSDLLSRSIRWHFT